MLQLVADGHVLGENEEQLDLLVLQCAAFERCDELLEVVLQQTDHLFVVRQCYEE